MDGASLRTRGTAGNLVIGLSIGFLAGVVAVAVFHQLAALVSGYVGLGEGAVYSFRPTAPFGVPRIMSQMFWGGVWGMLFAALFERRPAHWPVPVPVPVIGLMFGLFGPTLFGWIVVATLRGQPLFGNFVPARMLSSVLINGTFGIGLATLFTGLRRLVRGRSQPACES